MNKNIKKEIFTLSIIIFITIIFILIAVSKKENNISRYQHQERKVTYNYKTFKINLNNYDYSNMEYKNSIHYKKIYTYEDYKIYKKLWNDIIDVDENSFLNNFMIIGFTDSISMYGLTLGTVYTTDNILYIGLQKDKESNDGISILLPKELDRENLEIYKSIENENYLTSSEFIDIKQLQYNYTIEAAQNDNCVIISSNGKIYNKEIFYKFIDKVEEKHTSFIRIISYIDDNMSRIYDLKYDNENDIFLLCVDDTRTDFNRSYNYYTYTKLETRKTQEDDTLYKLTDQNEIDFDLCFINYRINN